MTLITQKQLDDLKKIAPFNQRLQKLGLKEAQENTKNIEVNYSTIKYSENLTVAGTITECEIRIGYVIFDVICLTLGAVGLRAGLSASTAEEMAEAAAPVLSKIERIIADISREGASNMEKAKGVFEILKIIYSGGCIGGVLKAFFGSLTPCEMVKYGAIALATIVAAVATDGLAFIAEVALVLITFETLVEDCVKAVNGCKPKPINYTITGFLIIGLDNKLYLSEDRKQPIHIDDGGRYTGVTVMNDGRILLLGMGDSTGGNLFVKEKIHSLPIKTSNPDAALAISIMNDGSILGVGANNELKGREKIDSDWVSVPNSGKVKSIVVSKSGTIYGIGMNNKIYKRSTLSDPWKESSDPAESHVISMSAFGDIIGIAKNNMPILLKEGKWVKISIGSGTDGYTALVGFKIDKRKWGLK